MRKILLTLIVTFLIGTCLTGCNPDTAKSATVCGGTVAISGLLVWAEVVDAPFVLSAIPNCVELVYDLFTSSSPSTSLSTADALNSFNSHTSMNDTTKVTLSNKYTYTKSVSSKVYSAVLANCIPLQYNPSLEYQISYRLSVDPTMGVGEKSGLRTFTSKASEVSPFGSVNRTLFNQYGLPSQPLGLTSSVRISVPVHEKIALSVFTIISYKYGVARIDQNGTTSYIPWLLTTSSKPTTRVQSDIQDC